MVLLGFDNSKVQYVLAHAHLAYLGLNALKATKVGFVKQQKRIFATALQSLNIFLLCRWKVVVEIYSAYSVAFANSSSNTFVAAVVTLFGHVQRRTTNYVFVVEHSNANFRIGLIVALCCFVYHKAHVVVLTPENKVWGSQSTVQIDGRSKTSETRCLPKNRLFSFLFTLQWSKVI